MSRPRPTSLVLWLLAAGIAYPDGARASDPNDLPRIALAPRRLETPVEQVAGTITIIGKEEIERRQRRTLPDLLEEVPGLNVVQSGGAGKQASLFTRGTKSDHTLVLLDGIEVMDPSLPGGSFDFAHLLTQNVERVEILRGPQSALYGSDAVGGVVNIVTERGSGAPSISSWAEAGGYNSTQWATAVRGGGPRLDYSLSYTNLHTRGFSVRPSRLGGGEDDGYANTSLSGRMDLAATRGLDLSFYAHLIDTHGETDAGGEDPDSVAETRQTFLRAEARHEAMAGRFSQKLGVGLTDHDRKDTDTPDPLGLDSSRSAHDGTRLKLDWQGNYRLDDHHLLTAGVETERESVDSRFRSPLFSNGVDESGRSSAVWLQEQFGFGDRLFGSAAVRLDHHDEFGSQPTYRTGLAYLHPTGTKLRGSVSSGFKAPGFDELFGASEFAGSLSFVGNPTLDPEKSVGWEVGLEQRLADGAVRIGSTYFRTKIRNLIVFAPGAFVSTVVNVDRAEIDGFESFVHAEIAERLWLRLDHTYLSAENDDLNQELLRRPKHKLTGRIEVRPIDPAILSLGVIYIGKRKDVDFSGPPFGRVTLGGYTVVNLAGSYEVSPQWTLYGRIDNLLDRNYEDAATFQSPGFVGYLGVRTKF